MSEATRGSVTRTSWQRLARSAALALLAGFSLLASAADVARVASADWTEAMAAFAESDKAAPSPADSVLFVGSSSIRLWTTLATDFPGVVSVNRGFGGSHISDSLVHFDRLVTPHHPRLIVFYAGTNDIASDKTPERVAADFREFCEKVHAIRPEARILFISLQLAPARWHLRERMTLTNAYVAAFCHADPRRRFVDTNASMLSPAGEPRLEFFREDKLHMLPAGYAEWTRILSPLVPSGVRSSANWGASRQPTEISRCEESVTRSDSFFVRG